MKVDEERVKMYLEGRGFTLERFSEAEMNAGKTPDFRVSRNGDFLFYCEVKSISKDEWLNQQLKSPDPDGMAGGLRNDPTYNRLTADIHQAIKQFDAVNKDQKYPNVLSFVNHNHMCDNWDLISILTGNAYTNDGEILPIYRQFSHGRIKNERKNIHLFIWLDDRKPDQLLFSQTNENHHAALCKMFNITQSEIKQIAP